MMTNRQNTAFAAVNTDGQRFIKFDIDPCEVTISMPGEDPIAPQ
jgi:hypothetical protein